MKARIALACYWYDDNPLVVVLDSEEKIYLQIIVLIIKRILWLIDKICTKILEKTHTIELLQEVAARNLSTSDLIYDSAQSI